MRFTDSLRIALHNLKINLSRSVLTVVIVSLISALIMSLLLIGIGFPQNRDDFGKLVIRRQGAVYTLYDRYSTGSRGRYKDWEPLTDKEYDFIRTTARNYENAVTDGKIIFSPSRQISIYAAYGKTIRDLPAELAAWRDHSYGLAQFSLKEMRYNALPENFLTEGRMWTEEDDTLPTVWLNTRVAEQYGPDGRKLHAGDAVVFFVYDFNNGKEPVTAAEYTVAGIFDPTELDEVRRQFYNVDSFMGYEGFQARIPENADSPWEREVSYLCYPETDDYDYGALTDDIDDYLEKVNDYLGRVAYNYDKTLLSVSRFRNAHIDEFQFVNQLNLLVVGVAAILSFIVLLLCIGSVANTVVISVDKNRKFLGLMKALGLDASGTRKIVLLEIFLLITVGILPGVGLTFAVRPLLISAIEMIFSLVFSGYPVRYAISLRVPFWLPIVTIFAFFLFAFLFSRKSLTKIVEQDAVRTLGEVS